MKFMGLPVMVLASVLLVELLLIPYRSWLKTEQTRQLNQKGAAITADIINELSEPLYISIGVASYIQSLNGNLAEGALDAWLSKLFPFTSHTRNIGIAPDNQLQFIYPLRGNEAALGVHYQNIDDQWQDVKLMMDTGQPMFIGPITLVQGGQGFAYRIPVFIDGSYWGLVSTIIDADSIYAAIFQDSKKYDLQSLRLQNQEAATFFSINEGGIGADDIILDSRISLPSTDWLLTISQEFNSDNLTLARSIGYGVVIFVLLNLYWVYLKSQENKKEEESVRASKLQFLASISHELKTPLTILQASLKMLADAGLDEDKKRSLIVAAGNHQKRLSRLILDLLDLNLAMNGQLNVHCEKVDLIEFVRLILEGYKEEFNRSELHLNLKLPEDKIYIETDKERLRQVLGHLIENAIKFSPAQGSIEVSLQKDEVLSLTVSDSGPGFPLKFLEHNSFAFTQLDGSDTRRYGGTGVGLALCKELCELLQTRLELNNNTLGGARVSVSWPILASEKK